MQNFNLDKDSRDSPDILTNNQSKDISVNEGDESPLPTLHQKKKSLSGNLEKTADSISIDFKAKKKTSALQLIPILESKNEDLGNQISSYRKYSDENENKPQNESNHETSKVKITDINYDDDEPSEMFDFVITKVKTHKKGTF